MIHLRFHRRGPSNPTSPASDRISWDPTALPSLNLHLTPDEGVPAPDIRPRSAASLTYAHANPPVLPPISRVVSSDIAWSPGGQDSEQKPAEDAKPRDDSKYLPKSPHAEQSSFLSGLALRSHRREQAVNNSPTSQREALNAPTDSTSTVLPTSGKASGSVKSSWSFASPTDSQNAPPTGRDHSKAKKTLPFLKNPVSSLLLRRKTNQTPPHLSLPLPNRREEPTYDPRIRGTRVHDFSAPRPWKPIVQPANVGNEPANYAASHGPFMPDRAPPVPPKDAPPASNRLSCSHSKSLFENPPVQCVETKIKEETNQWEKSSPVRSNTSMSRNVSATSAKGSFSAIPRHMKSTSSRFSFDMIGAAEQEKILEERHRQRQQDRRSDVPGVRRDSRFDEFDDDAFDYDAMNYDDDGLEERIPGVNADYEEDFCNEVDDPDNDQENFAGFSFQRSDPTSSLTTPHSTGVVPTPRDASGHMIGEAETGESIGSDQCQESSEYTLRKTYSVDSSTGLGIQELQPVMEHPGPVIPQVPAPRPDEKIQLSKDDELYFNDGLIHDFDGEGDGSAFDESIFDLNDTDQYGRPIPGMFASALAQRAAPLDTEQRESDITSRHSAQSTASQSTAHTSLSAGAQSESVNPQVEAGVPQVTEPQVPESQAPEPQAPEQASSNVDTNALAAYQAALAAATYKAAASGKFRRDFSPDPPTERTITSPTILESSEPQSDTIDDDPLAGYEDEDEDEFSTGLDDYELDDDYITAEANASVLANDFDGWYGQEFGFYSAPVPQSSHVHGLLSEKNLYQYSSGGYFGPSGINHSISGRLVSREPNLTPITERSEYSNRNSLMSTGWPQVPTSGGTIQSPGLTQLAMMTDDQDMSLAGLLRLRSKAWGGSQVSLTSSREGSPFDRNDGSSALSQELSGISLAPGRNSAFSYYSQDSTGPGSNPDSPTLTLAIPNVSTNSIPSLAASSGLAASMITAPGFSPLTCSTPFPPLSEVEEPTCTETTGKSAQMPIDDVVSAGGAFSKHRSCKGHRHNKSSASVS
ncbi:hypothetical protein GGS21DRAFT_500865 [Xylaria nigripes]|nr:hypothetical protein GGS21DRAFT_500865 [Xylaria nigripes]